MKADQDVAQATGQANAVKALAEGDAQAILTKAKAQAQANDLLAKSLTPPFIEYAGLQKWDGRLPLFTGGGGTPLIDVSRLMQKPNQPAAGASPTPQQ